MAYYPGTKYVVCTRDPDEPATEYAGTPRISAYTVERGVFHSEDAANALVQELTEGGEPCQVYACRWVEVREPSGFFGSTANKAK